MKLPVLSPNTKVTQDFSTSQIEINYSRPSVRGRQIFGGVVPFGKIWRTGANAVTRISFGEDLDIAGNMVKAGDYALYTIPNEDSWEVIINTGVGNWGTGGYSTNGDVARFSVVPEKTAHLCPTLTIDVTDITFNTCSIEIMWENVKVAIPLTTDNEARINSYVDETVSTDTAPHVQIATYYVEKQQHPERAKLAIDKALELQPKAYYMWHMKAKIEKMLGSKEEALAAANNSLELSIGSPHEAIFKGMNMALIAELN